MTKGEILSALKGAAIAALVIGLYWLTINAFGAFGLF